MSIAEEIKAARKRAGLTQKQLADRLETTPQNLSQYENGKRSPKYETLEKIAGALGVPILDLRWGPGSSERVNATLDPILEKEVQKQSTLFYSVIKTLEAIYGYATSAEVSVIHNGVGENQGNMIFIGDGDEKIVITNVDFDNILKLVEDVLRNAVSMLGNDEKKFLRSLAIEPDKDKIVVEADENVKFALFDRNDERYTSFE